MNVDVHFIKDAIIRDAKFALFVLVGGKSTSISSQS